MRTRSLLRISNMADADISSSRIDIEDFEFILLHEYMSDNRKVSRKKHILNYTQEQLFLPEGHCSCVLWETTSTYSLCVLKTHITHNLDHRETLDDFCSYFFQTFVFSQHSDGTKMVDE